jgi:hypothetical protein
VVQYYSYYDYYYELTFYQDQYGYSFAGETWGTPYTYVWAPVVYAQTVYQVIAAGLAYAVANATTNPPSIGSLSLWSGETGPGGSGYWVLLGTALANVFGPTTASTTCAGVSVNPTYSAPRQVNLSFSVASSAPWQTCNVTIWTPNGSSSIQLPHLFDGLILQGLADIGLIQDYAINGDDLSGTFTDDFLSDYATTMRELGYVDSTWPGLSPGWTITVQVLARALGAQAALLAAILVQDGSSGRHFPQEKDLIANCVPGRLVIEPATAIRFRGGISYEQEYICPAGRYAVGTVFTIHWIVRNGKVIHGPHPRLGPPQGGGGA